MDAEESSVIPLYPIFGLSFVEVPKLFDAKSYINITSFPTQIHSAVLYKDYRRPEIKAQWPKVLVPIHIPLK